MFQPWPELRAHWSSALDALDANPGIRVTDLRASSLFFFIVDLLEEQRRGNGQPVVLVTETNSRAARMQQFLIAAERLITDREPLPEDFLVFPDFEPQNLFEYFDPPLDLVEARNAVLSGLLKPRAAGRPRAIVTSYKACWRLLPDPADFADQDLLLRCADKGWPRELLARRLAEMGYQQVSTVTSVGEYALRGGLVDVFPIGRELPARIDLFGEEVDRISDFEPATQRSTAENRELQVEPIAPQIRRLANSSTIDWLRERWSSYRDEYREQLGRSQLDRLSEVVESDLELLEQGAQISRSGWYWQAVQSNSRCLWHYLPKGSPVIVHEEGFVESETNSYFRFWQSRFTDWLKNGLSFLSLEDFYVLPTLGLGESMRELSAGRMRISTSSGEEVQDAPALSSLFTHSFDAPQRGLQVELPSFSAGLEAPAPGHWGTLRLPETVRGLPKPAVPIARIDRPLTVLTQFSQRVRELLSDEGLHPEVSNAILPGGFVIPGAQDWTVVTDVEIFGEIAEVAETPVRKHRNDGVKRPDELSPGDFVVHIDYGVGRFAQLTDRQQSGVTKSFVEVEYAGRDKLFVPVEQLDRLKRYTFDGTPPQLNHLGRDTWKKTKEKVRADTLELARKLLALYKTRQVRSGNPFSTRTVWEEEFAEGFPYELTGDQLKAWREVETDMEALKPMDRLLIGDVGFGKTEVAMRAAFKACVDERQVLVLCPTTVLADQHFHTFTQRFRPFPFRVGVLSRFQSAKEVKSTIEDLKGGKIDVLIATHRGLSKDVVFERPGLLIIDEEQRFGVKQKEALKMRFPLVDVLAMSATPIPRTLHMSLIGLRDISVIETAPLGRKAVKTYVGEFDEIMIREAILRELSRGGQIYFLHNRVADIEKTKERIERLIPQEFGGSSSDGSIPARVLIAHGQMRDERLEEIMHAFELGAYKVLLATTIIENGLDIPSVNTIIIDHAESLGLSQMHQLRGRVGRSSQQAYAYFFHEPQRVLTEEAQNRLHAIYNYAYLGAGYEIAQNDLRIRGAGNLLGEDQSGIARQVGFEYYCELLARSIRDVKELSDLDLDTYTELPNLEERPGTQLDIPLPAFIPEGYVEDPVLRLDLLRRISQLASAEQIDEFAIEVEDRFGPPPEELSNLLLVMRVKNVASALGLERLTYNRVKGSFSLYTYAGEKDWQKRAGLRDSRFSLEGMGVLTLALPFGGPASAEDLLEALSGLTALREAVR